MINNSAELNIFVFQSVNL